MSKTILSYGETLWDLLPSGPVLGGAPFNFAYRVNCLGDRGLIVTRLGRDELGRRAHRRILQLGIETRFVQWDDDAPTGTVEVDLTDSNNPDFTILPDVAYDRIEPTEAMLKAASEADCVCFGTLIQRAERSRRTLYALLQRAGNAVKLLDINLRKNCFSDNTVRASLEKADVLKLNDDEARRLDQMLDLSAASSTDFADAIIRRFGLTHCVVTFGERGAYATDGRDERAYVPGYAVDLVDSCGSGDAFTAGFVHGLLRGDPLLECCRLGNALGAIVATQDGATGDVAPDEVHAFLAAEYDRVLEPALADMAAG